MLSYTDKTVPMSLAPLRLIMVAQLLQFQTLNYKNSGSKCCAAVSDFGPVHSLYCSRSLHCVTEYLALDS